MGTGLHGKSGRIPLTILQMWETFIMPILLYKLEIDQLSCCENKLNEFQNKTMKQLLGLPNNTPEWAIYCLTGLLPPEAIVHKKFLSTLGAICRSPGTTLWNLMERQVGMYNIMNTLWFSLALHKLPEMYAVIAHPVKKNQWKKQVNRAVNRVWENWVERCSELYPSLRHLGSQRYRVGQPHFTVASAPTKLRLLTGADAL